MNKETEREKCSPITHTQKLIIHFSIMSKTHFKLHINNMISFFSLAHRLLSIYDEQKRWCDSFFVIEKKKVFQRQTTTKIRRNIYINEIAYLLINPTEHFLTSISHIKKSIIIFIITINFCHGSRH